MIHVANEVSRGLRRTIEFSAAGNNATAGRRTPDGPVARFPTRNCRAAPAASECRAAKRKYRKFILLYILKKFIGALRSLNDDQITRLIHYVLKH